MVAPKNIVESYRELSPDIRESLISYWRNQMNEHIGTALEDFCRGWILMIDGDRSGADAALQRVLASADSAIVAQAQTVLALLHEDEPGAPDYYALAASDQSATFAMYAQAIRLREDGRLHDAEALLRGALDHADEGDEAGIPVIVGECVNVLLALDRRDDAITMLQDAIEKQPYDLTLRRRLMELR